MYLGTLNETAASAMRSIRWVSSAQVFLIAAVMAASVGRAFAQTQTEDSIGWKPEQTRVFLVDVLLYEGKKEIPDSWLEIPASDMVDQFRKFGVPAEQITLLQKEDASAQNVNKQLTAFLKKSSPGEMLVFYFGGHSARNTLKLHDKSVQKSWLIDTIETNFRGNRAMLFIDSCYSGGVVDLVANRKSRISYAALSSTYSQQTASSGCRFFQCLLRGFGGDPVVDSDQDGHVTFDELARYTERYMAYAAEGKPIYATTGKFDPKLRLAKATGKAADRVGELIEAKRNGKWQPAEILAIDKKGFKVHYTRNTKSDDDEVVSKDDIRPVQFSKFKVGERVEVLSGKDDKWHSAKVLATFENLHGCRCDDLPPSDDEWFGPSRIRLPER